MRLPLAAALAVCACASIDGRDVANVAGAPSRALHRLTTEDASPPASAATLTPSEYCTEANGFAAGARGEAYAGVCPVESAGLFLVGHGAGEKLFALEHNAIAAAQSLSDATKDLWRVRRRIMEAETRRKATTTTRSERNHLSAILKTLQSERLAGEAEVRRLSEEKAKADDALAMHRAAASGSQSGFQ